MNPKPLGQRIRSFFEQLLTSRHVRFLETELIRVRLEKDAVIKRLHDQQAFLQGKVDKLELAMWPKAFLERKEVKAQTQQIDSQPASFAEALEQHNRELAKADDVPPVRMSN